ncbi:HlyD family secretion protein [Sandaracinobacteroides saxicola]|uniref:HlyD family secretion protein n=1 Tax=Sandaracinobacteroides saxicola TaxID=2759707 RepID=A0A7G5IHE0_9SPHN|nr:HlyD family secretion protein [Sandaracinobacteroides saxicola]QMW22782.1 HlyD family secretion protein [Sandaracinobacteroides saxicola]
MRRFIFPGILALVMLLALGVAIWWFTQGRYVESTDNAYVEADIAVIAPKVPGYVASVPVTDNQPVKAGDPLLTIVDADYRAALAKAEAEVDRQRRALGTAAATVTAQQSGISEAEAALRSAEAQAVRARADAARAADLVKAGWATKALMDSRTAEAKAAEAAIASARAAVSMARAQTTAASGSEGGAGAALRAAIAARDAAALDLANTVIRSPVDGVVGNRSARVGQYARQGLQLMVVVPLDAAYVVANFKETQIARMKPGMPVTLKVDAFPDVAMKGRLLSLSPAAGSRFSLIPPENATGNFTRIVQRVPVKVEIVRPLPQGVRLVPGLSVTASIDLRDAE